MRQLVQCALRMRPDRIIVTELCGAETTEILDGINHGYDGAILCMQSNGPRDTLARLERMDALGNPEVPLLQLREQIASSIDLIVHQERLRDGSRRIVNICEVTGMDQGVVTLSDIFYFSQTGFENGLVQASLMTTGLIPRFMKKLDEMGRGLPLSFFTTGEV